MVLAIFDAPRMSIEELGQVHLNASISATLRKPNRNPKPKDDRNCIQSHRLLSYQCLCYIFNTFVEAVQTNGFNFEVTIESHLPVDCLTKGCFSSCTTSCNSDEYTIGGNFWNMTCFSFHDTLVKNSLIIIITLYFQKIIIDLFEWLFFL